MTPYYEESGITLYHGDCREYEASADELFDCSIADPPYGETSLAWDRWPAGWPHDVQQSIKLSGSLWCFGSTRMFLERWDDFVRYWQLSQDIIWEKHNGSSFHADRFKRVHENILHFYMACTPWGDVYKCPVTTPDATKRTVRRKQRPPHTGHIEASSYASEDGGPRLMRSVIQCRSCHGYAQNETQKPVEIIKPLIEYACPPGGRILVPFAGAGSELVAAKEMGRQAVGFEIREEQCEIAANRLRQGVLFSASSTGGNK